MTTIDQKNNEYAGPVGLGGWLILPIIGLFIAPFLATVLMVTDVLPCFKPEIWSAATTPGGDIYHPLWAPLTIFDALKYMIILIGSIVLLVLLFKKKKVFPKIMIAYFIFSFSAIMVDFITATYLATNMNSQILTGSQREGFHIIRDFFWTFVWTLYFLTSKRVTNTFVN